MRKLIVLSIILLVASIGISSDESLEAKIVRLEKVIENQNRTINRAEKMVNSLKEQIAELEKENKRLLSLCRKAKIDTRQKLDDTDSTVNKIQLPLGVGQVVYFEDPQDFKIEQVIDSQNMIVEARIDYEPIYGSVGESRFLTTSPVIGTKTVSRHVWISGLNTSDYVDGITISPDSALLFKITGTKQYETVVGGLKTLFVFEPFIRQEQK